MPDEQTLTEFGPAEEREDMPLPHDPKTVFLGGLFLLATLAALYVARDVILPVAIALVLKLLLQPLVRQLERFQVPKALGALVCLLLLLGVIAGLGTILSNPASRMIRDLPGTLAKLQETVEPLRVFAERFQGMMGSAGMGDGAMGDPAETLKAKAGSIAGSLAAGASSFASHLLETLLILFYMLVFGETFMRRFVEILPRFRDKRQAVDISGAVERDISAYLLTISIINAVVGIACAGVMWAFGVPGPLLWGVVAFCLNFVPILGPFFGILLFTVIGLATLGAAWSSLLPAAVYLAIHFAEGEIITPLLLAKRFTLNPIGIMVGLVFWYWMWGIQGAILSVPLLAITKIVSDRLRPFRALGHLLEG